MPCMRRVPAAWMCTRSVEVPGLSLTKGEIYLDCRTMGQAALQLEHGPRYFIAEGHLAATLLRPRSAPIATLGWWALMACCRSLRIHCLSSSIAALKASHEGWLRTARRSGGRTMTVEHCDIYRISLMGIQFGFRTLKYWGYWRLIILAYLYDLKNLPKNVLPSN